MTTNQRSTDADVTPPKSRLGSPQRKQRLAWVALIGVLLLGGYFRTLGLFSWDDPSYRLHPDERFMTDVASLGRVPSGLGQYLDSSLNPLNPRNNGKEFYVYGLLPQTLTRLAAVMLTPDSMLPAIVPEDHSANAAQIPNPELRVPKLLPLQAVLNPTGLNLTEYGEIHKVGRAWSALFDIGSLALVFLIARRLYGRRVGLLAALLLAGSVLPIQLAHFFTVDAITAFFTLLTVYWAVRLAQGGGPANYIPLGLSIGIAMACRVTMASLALLAALVAAQRIWHSVRGRSNAPAPPNEDPRPAPSSLLPAFAAQFTWLALAGVVAFLAFRMLQPDAFLGTSAGTPQPADQPPTSLDRLLQGRGFFDIRPDPRFVANYRSISEQFSGEADWPPSQQWTGRPRFLFALQNMVIWGMGIPLGLMAWAGWALAGWQIVRRRVLAHLIPWAWITFYFGWQGGQAFMTMRYYSMLYGLLIIFAAWLLVKLWDRRPTLRHSSGQATDDRQLAFRPNWRRWSLVVGRWSLVVVVLGTFCWAYAFTRIYTQPHSRIAASRWIYANIPAGAAITSESWDDGLPLDLDGYSHDRYIGIQTYPYAEDDESKYIGSVDKDGKRVPGLFDQLDQADYVILTSNRVYGSATRLPMRYPALTRYYHYLFSGELGFAQVADITSYPALFGIAIPDQSAEEAFTVYDHPRVLIFKKNAAYSRANTERLIAGDVAWDEVYKLPTIRASKVPTALRLTEAQWPGYRAAGTWAALFNPASLSNQVPVLAWLLALELIGLAVFPLLFHMLPGLPDRGFALAKTLALLLVAYAAWLLGSFHLLAFTPGSVWLCAGLLIAAGAVVGWRSRAELLAFARRRRTALLAAEGLFLLAFLGFVLIRALNPDLWHPARGGEKPMDLAFLTAVLKSDAFPAYDPWFAGGYINYYYFGFVFVGALIHLTGIVPTTAYNLAVPTLFALTALGAWGVAYNLVGTRDWGLGTRSWRLRSGSVSPSPTPNPQPPRRERRAIITGIVAAAFVVLLGPLTQALWYLPGSAMPAIPGQPPGCQASYAVQQQQQCSGRSEWAFWDATRLVGMDLQDSTITEFPFFTFLFADLHAHMIALPLTLAALGLMVALVRPTTNDEGRKRWRALVVRRSSLVLLALVIGALRATNTWDYPTYLGLSLLTLVLIGWRRVRRGESQPRAILFWVGSSLVLVLGSSLLFLPFTRSFATDYAGFQLWSGSRTSAVDFLKINGLWLFLLGSAALLIYRRVHRTSRLILALIGGGALALALAAVLSNALALVLLVPLAGAALGLLVDLLFGNGQAQPEDVRQSAVHDEGQDKVVATTAWIEDSRAWIEDSRPPVSLTTQLPVLWGLSALMIALITEVLVAKGDIGRMNTVFKFGLQSWVLFALTSALAFSALWPAIVVRRVATAGGREHLAAYAWRAAAVVLIAAALVYPLTATPARVADRIDPGIGPTLDGIAFMRSDKGSWSENNQSFTFVQDAAALDWMRTNISGTPIVLEAHTEAYRWGGRVSIYTGLPTLLGWPWHETQQRSVATVGPVLTSRQSLIQDLYSRTDQSAALRKLRLYGVEYVYVGQLERALYDPAGLAKFDMLTQSGQIQQVYAAGDTRIYQIPRETGAPTPALLTTSLAVRPPTLPAEKLLLDTPIYLLPALNDYAWNRLADSQPVAVLLWLLACYALLALGLPPALMVFGRAADGGYAWARLIGLLLLGYAVWMPVSMRLWSYTRASVLMGALLVLALDVVIIAWLGLRTEDERPFDAAQDRRTTLRRRSGQANDERPEIDAGQESGVRRQESGDGNRRIDDATEGDETSSSVLPPPSILGRPTTDDAAEGDEVSSIVRRPSPALSRVEGSFVLGLRILRDQLRSKRRAVLTIEVLFLGAFVFMAVLRALNPDLWQPVWGGEKPFEFGFFNAILRSPVIPPYDPFYSDGVINYYYYGLFLVSVPVKAIGIAPAVAFNLIVPTLFAFTLIGAFALVRRLTGRVWAGLAGGAFVALLGNLAAAFPVGLSQGLAPVRTALGGGLAGFGARLGDWFWGPSRVVYTDTLITINEFPYWSYLFADLHPHLIAMPITILVAALAFELFDRRRKTKDVGRKIAWSVRPSSFVLGLWFLAALALGALAITNAWDFPTYALLLGGALLGRAWRDSSAGDPARTRREQALALGRALLAASGVVLVALLLYLPFFQNFQRPAGVSGLGLVKDGTPLGGYLLIYGLFLALLGLWVFGVLARLAHGTRQPSRTAAPQLVEEQEPVDDAAVLGFVARRSSFVVSWRMLRLALASVLALLLIAVALQPKLAQGLWASPLLLKAGLLVLVVAGARVLLARRLPAAAWFAAWLAVLAWAVSFGIELFYLRDHLDGGAAYRMNTVFKFGLQAWILLALAAAAALPGLARGLRRAGILAQGLVWAAVAALVALALIFPLVGTPSRLANRFPASPGPTLDGLAFMDLAAYDWQGNRISLAADADAIRWLNEHISGTPIVLQSSLEFYRAYGVRIAANTGLPTIVSPLHASEQHDPDLVADRDRDVQMIYSTPDPNQALQLLSKYHVGYVYVGPIERAAYGEPGTAKFDQLDGSYLTLLYKNEAVKIYQVNQNVYSRAPETITATPATEPPLAAPAPAPAPNSSEPTIEALERQAAADPTASGPAFELAQRYRDTGQLDKAVAAIEQAARAHSDDVALNQLWGDILRDAGRADQAEAAYRAAIAASPTAGNYNKLGVELIGWGKLDQAAEAFNQAIAADANAAEPYYHLGEIYEQQSQIDQAATQYRAYLNIAGPDALFSAQAKAALERLKK